MEDFKQDKLYCLIYDSECTFCERFKQGLEFVDTDKKIQFLSLHDSGVYDAFPRLDPEKCRQSVHIVRLEDFEVFRAGEVVVELSKIFPGVSKFAWLLETDRGRQAADFFYKKLDHLRKKSAKNCRTCS